MALPKNKKRKEDPGLALQITVLRQLDRDGKDGEDEQTPKREKRAKIPGKVSN